MGNGDSVSGGDKRKDPKPRGRLARLARWLARRWYLLIASVIVGLVIAVLTIPISYTPEHYGDGLRNLFGGLIALYQQAPTVVYVVVGAVVILTILGYLENERIKAEKQPPASPTAASAANVAAPRGLPLPPALIGRDAELATLVKQLRDGESVGVFALEGIGGVGKTALAAVAVARLSLDAAAFPGGAAWIACEGLAGPDGLSEVWARVAEALGLPGITEKTSEPARRAALTAELARRPRTLLALDNVEPGLSGALTLEGGQRRPGAEVLLEALALPGHTAVLFTSRQGLLSDRLVPIYLDVLSDDDAARLFGEILAREGKPQGARPTPDDQARIPAVVAAVGGLPLAITLAATYTAKRGLTLASLQHELEQDGLSARALKDRRDPQRGVAVRFARSYGILSPAERQLFAGLSLLAGASFPRAAALAVAGAGFTNRLGAQRAGELPADNLDRLVEYALVEALPDERLRLHPLLREYAGERLREGGRQMEESLGDALLRYWISFAQAHPDYEGMDALEAEAEGLMGALTWAHAHQRHRDLLRLAHALGKAWDVRGRRADELTIYAWAEEAAERLEDHNEQWWALHQLTATYAQVGRRAEARAGFERTLALARELGDKSAEQSELHELAVLDADAGRLAEARAGLERALALARELGDKSAERRELHGLAVLDARTGRVAEARAGLERALALARELGDPAAEWRELRDIALLDQKAGRLAEARSGYERALAIAKQLGDPASQRMLIHDLAVVDALTGRVAEARAGYERALALARQLGDPSAEADELQNLGILIGRRMHDPSSGRPFIEQSLAILERLGDPFGAGVSHWFLGELDEMQDHRASAIAHYREALRLFEQVQVPEAEQVRADLRRLEGAAG